MRRQPVDTLPVKDFLLGLVVAIFAAGCSTPHIELGPRYEPANVHAVASMPAQIRRIALLPIAAPHSDSVTLSGTEILSAIFEAELRKSTLFEVVPVSEAQLQQWTGRASWRSDEALPRDFFARLNAETACDAVVFPVLTAYRAYPPLAVGLEIRLLTCTAQTLWAVDEMLDAGAASVVRSARDYAHSQLQVRTGEEDVVLQSPKRFAQFASATLIATLPQHEKSLKEPKEATMTGTRGQP